VFKQLKEFCWQWRGVWITAPSVTVLVILLRLTGLLQSWELVVFDQYMRLRPQEDTDQRIAIVGIDEGDIKKIGQPIFPDQVYVDLLNKLKAMQPRAIGLDIYRDYPVEPGHKALSEVFESTPNLVGIRKVVGDERREVVAAPPILETKGQVGANDLMFDHDQKVRRGLIVINDQGRPIPSFGMYLAAMYLDAEGIGITTYGEKGWWQLGETVFVPFQKNDGAYVQADAGENQFILNYRGPARTFETVSLTDILEDRLPPDWGKDRIILIGAISESSNDLLATPYTRTPSQRMPGVEVHANITSQIISAVVDNRPLWRVWPDSVEYAWIFLWATVGSILTWSMRHADTNKSFFILKVIILGLAAVTLGVITYLKYLYIWWIPVVPSFLALGGSAIAITAYIARTAGDIRNTFGRYLSNEIVATLLESPEGLKLGGERKKITLLTSDLRGFTATSERLPPEEVVKILNYYLGFMADVITKYQGTIDEFMGDGILVLFGAPISRPDDATRAIACSLEMQLAMKTVNQKMKEWQLPPLEMGIGINTGEVVVGNIGSEKRTKYGVVGNQVNLTYRIESYTIGGQIIISETTLNEAGSIVKIVGEKQVTPKGVKAPLMIYEVGGIEGDYNIFLEQDQEIFVNLPQVIKLRYSLLKGKDISDEIILGQLIQLSAKNALIKLEDPEMTIPEPLSNIKINFFEFNSEPITEDIYAKVLEDPAENHHFYIRFTAQPPQVKLQLDQLYETLQNTT
jgi:adenylate cyclase